VKEGLGHPLCLPAAVVLDPAATLGTPVRLLKTTGMKSVDHAVEGALSVRPSPLAEAAAVKALDLLWRGLPGLGGAKDGAELRQDLQFASWLSIVGAGAGSPVGASHAIGHVLGGLGVAHGETTGVLLPAVLRWNAPANAERQKDLLASLGSPASDLPPDLATGIADLARRLEVPTRLRDLNLSRDLLGEIAEKTMAEASLRANPRKIASADQVGEILDLAW
ncbi:MAG: hypothetical protein ACREEX_13325, partial [Caulobacteraceae bacterium]